MNDKERSIDKEFHREKTFYRKNNPENPQDLTDRDSVHSMTEEEIERFALSDPDALPFEDDWEDAIVVYPRNA